MTMAVFVQDAKAKNQNPRSTPLIIGHRGASRDAPENTIAAFDLAIEQHADGIEFDVQLSKDGVPVVIHDPMLRRTTSGRGPVRGHTLAELKQLDAGFWFDRAFPARAGPSYVGERIPTLAETLDWVCARQCLAYLEIKRGWRPSPGIEERVLAEIRRARVLPLVTVISFDLPTLRRVRKLDPQVAVGIDFTEPRAAVELAQSIRAQTILPSGRFLRRRFIARAQRAGLTVVVWDVDRGWSMRRRVAAGVDGVITGYPGWLCETLRGPSAVVRS